jgi:hypothetical protein
LTDLNLPSFPFKLRSSGQNKQIFDLLRRRYVTLTPEEWVRQHFIQYLINSKRYPAALIAVEKGIKVQGLQKRADVVVFNRYGNPWMIVECKAPDVGLNEETLYQAARYNMALKVRYLVLTNGLEHFCCVLDDKRISFMDDLPGFGE